MQKNYETGKPLDLEELARPYLWAAVEAFGFSMSPKDNDPSKLFEMFHDGRQLKGLHTPKNCVGLFLGYIVRTAISGEKMSNIVPYKETKDNP